MTSIEGRAAVVAEAVNGAGAEIAGAEKLAAGEQVEMFAVPTRFRPEDPRHAEQLERTRRPGRPPGAVNKSTAAFRDYLLARGVNPLEQLMRWSLHTPESLAAELGCTTLEAFRELRVLLCELAPYFASKVVATDAEGRAVPQFMMVFGGAGNGNAPGAAAPWLYLEHEQNQPLGDGAPAQSHGAQSHGQAK
jgi:hypothetical protein